MDLAQIARQIKDAPENIFMHSTQQAKHAFLLSIKKLQGMNWGIKPEYITMLSAKTCLFGTMNISD